MLRINLKSITAAVLMGASCIQAHADEGMWMISNIPSTTMKEMNRMGLQLSAKQLYSPNSHSLTNSVILFGGICSGVVVSPEGLVFTNHHCGFESIQQHSSVEHDYLKDGFSAANLQEEIPTPGLYVGFLVRTDNVTKRVMKALRPDMKEYERDMVIDSISSVLQAEVSEKDDKLVAEVTPYFNGTEFYMSVYRNYTDIRLVLAPPSSVGKFGGDTDNWMWPRQTGDFSIFRIYADKDGNPAAYSPDNVPLATPDYAPISLNGYVPGSFSMTIGYPGDTQRYMSSYGIEDMVKSDHEATINFMGRKLKILKKYMDADEAIRIKYDAKYASAANAWKNNLGMDESIERLGIIKQKRALEAQLDEWAATSKRGASFRGVMERLRKAYDANAEVSYALSCLYTAFSVPDLSMLTMRIMNRDFSKEEDEDIKQFKNTLKRQYDDTDMGIDCELMGEMFESYREAVKGLSGYETYLPEFYAMIDSTYGGDCKAFARYIYANSAFTDFDRIMEVAPNDTSLLYTKDICLTLALDVMMKIYDLRDMLTSEDIVKGERQLWEALRNMEADKRTFYSDANFTMRLSYGTVGGYAPDANTSFNYFSTPRELLEKVSKSKDMPEYRVNSDIMKLMHSNQFGRYTDKTTGEMQLCFLTNNDITGGNSGSPIFNGRGELIGLAFDGNWEALCSDIKFEPRLQRCIGVDVRYILFLIEKWAKNERLINEVKVK